MYTIIGGDGKEYGPVTSEQVKAWIGAGRANLDTQAKALGSDAWKRLGDFPEFGAPGGFAPPPLGAVPAGEAAAIAAGMTARGLKLDFTRCFERSWRLVKSQFWALFGVTAVVFVIEQSVDYAFGAVLGQIPSLIAGLSLSLVFAGGIQYYFLKKVRGQPAALGDAFAGFTQAFLPLLLAGIVSTLLVGFGCVLFILPGVYLAVSYIFASILVMDQGLGFWTALEVSRRVVTAQWLRVFGLVLMIFVILLPGLSLLMAATLFNPFKFLAYPVMLVTMPFIYGATVSAYEELCGTAPVPSP